MTDFNREVVRGQLQDLAQFLELRTPPGWGFALMMFDFNEGITGGNFQWVSSAVREDMVKALREFANRLEQKTAGEPGIDEPESFME